MRIPRIWTATSLIAFSALALTTVAQADGRLEINQASIDAGGGFPLTITEPGSYKLTGSLAVPANADGIVIQTTDVTLDLNGFAIVGPASCNTSSCTSGNGRGITPWPSVAFGHFSTIRNGTIRGFASSCVTLGRNANVTNLNVRDCGGYGISVNVGSSVTHNRVTQTGLNGIRMSQRTVYGHNTASISGLAGGGEHAYDGGTATAGNTSDDASTAPRGERRYYLTPDSAYNGAQAANACDAGFHLASMWEILDPSQLYYDTTRGLTTLQAGESAVAGAGTDGWIRPGNAGGGFDNTPGGADCAGYASASGLGTTVYLNRLWSDEFNGIEEPNPTKWWSPRLRDCSVSEHVWCVED